MKDVQEILYTVVLELCQLPRSLVQCLSFWRRQLFRPSVFLSSFTEQIYIEQLLWARKCVRHFGRYEDESDQNPGRTQPPRRNPECAVVREGAERNVVLMKNWGSVSPGLSSAGVGMTSPITATTPVTLCPWDCHSTRLWQLQNSVLPCGGKVPTLDLEWAFSQKLAPRVDIPPTCLNVTSIAWCKKLDGWLLYLFIKIPKTHI